MNNSEEVPQAELALTFKGSPFIFLKVFSPLLRGHLTPLKPIQGKEI